MIIVKCNGDFECISTKRGYIGSVVLYRFKILFISVIGISVKSHISASLIFSILTIKYSKRVWWVFVKLKSLKKLNIYGITRSHDPYPHEKHGLCLSLLGLRKMNVHFISIKVSVIWSTDTLIETKCSPWYDFGLLIFSITMAMNMGGLHDVT